MEEAEEKKDKKRKYALSSKKRLHLTGFGRGLFYFAMGDNKSQKSQDTLLGRQIASKCSIPITGLSGKTLWMNYHVKAASYTSMHSLSSDLTDDCPGGQDSV